MKTTTKAYIVTGLSYAPVVWVMAQIWWSWDFKNCVAAPMNCTGLECEPMGVSAPICSPTPLAWILLILLALLPIATLLFWRKNVITKKRP